MRELREETFFGNKNKDAHNHVDRALNIVSLSNIHGVSQGAILLCVFMFTLTGTAKRWVDRLTPGAVNTWDLFKKAFIQRTLSMSLSSNSNTDGLAAIVRPHLDKECPLNKEVKQTEETKYGEFSRPTLFNGSNGAKYRVGLPGYYTRTDNRPPYGEKRLSRNYRGASINVMPKGIFDFLKLTNLRKTNMLIKMADMNKKAPLEVVESVLVGIDKFLFPSDFAIIDRNPNETVILGRPFLITVRAEIHVFDRKITLGVDNDRIIFDMDHNFTIPTERILMMNLVSNKGPSHTSGNPSLKQLKTDNLYDRQEQQALDPDKDPRGRSFDDYKWVFDLDIEQLADEYELRIEKKGHVPAARRQFSRPSQSIVMW
ncbi:putative reverse transcriptase domain-containing protein [Tanacetum coccineum]